MEEDNIALNPKREGYPTPLESDRGWGGGGKPWEIVDGKRVYPGEWAHGLAFTGGRRNWATEACGERQATIDFGEPKTFYKVIIWHHGLMHIPQESGLRYWNGSRWMAITSRREVNLKGEHGTWSAPETHLFTPVTGSKVRYVFNNCEESMEGKKMEHGWLYEFEVYEAEAVSELIGGFGIETVEGIGESYGKGLRRQGIEKIVDLAQEDMRDVPALAQSSGVPLLNLYVAKIRAELALSVRIDPVLMSTGKSTLEDILNMSYEELRDTTGHPMDAIHGLKKDICRLLCALDNGVILPKTVDEVLMWKAPSTAAEGEVIIEPVKIMGTSSYQYTRPCVTADNDGNLHLLWNLLEGSYETGGERERIWYSKLDRNGTVLVAPKPLLMGDGYFSKNRNPNVTVDDDGNLHVIWFWIDKENLSLWYSKLDNSGGIVIAPHSLETDWIGGNPDPFPAIAKDKDGNLQVLVGGWSSNQPNEVWHTKMDKEGEMLTDAVKLATPSRKEPLLTQPAIAVDNDGHVHALLSEPGFPYIWYTRLDTNGNALIDPSMQLKDFLNEGGYYYDGASITKAPDNGLYAILSATAQERPYDYTLWYTKIDNDGKPLAGPLELSLHGKRPAIAVDVDGNIQIVWKLYDGELWYAKVAGKGKS